MTHRPWRGVIEEFRDRLDLPAGTRAVTLLEGGTPLVPAPTLSARTACDVWLKVEGVNPTGSFKDRGMTVAISAAVARGTRAVLCASTGNTSASAAAYAARAGIVCGVLVPHGRVTPGKLAQAVVHGAVLLELDGSFDDCLRVARDVADSYPVTLVNSVNPDRIDGQKTAAYEIVAALGRAPDVHCLPVGNAGNITAYWRGYTDELTAGHVAGRPAMWGFQAAGAAPIVRGEPVADPQTIASAIRIGNPASWTSAVRAQDESGGRIDAVPDDEILRACQLLAATEGTYVEPASAIGVAGLLQVHAAGELAPGQIVVCTVTGHGLKDTQWVAGYATQPVRRVSDVAGVAAALDLSEA